MLCFGLVCFVAVRVVLLCVGVRWVVMCCFVLFCVRLLSFSVDLVCFELGVL